jgi:hypothetical protein
VEITLLDGPYFTTSLRATLLKFLTRGADRKTLTLSMSSAWRKSRMPSWLNRLARK